MMKPNADGWIDLTIPIHPDMPIWPGNPEVSLRRSQCLAHGDVCNVSELRIGTHTGTHVDGLNHFIKDAAGVNEMPPSTMVGLARVIEIRDRHQITRAELEEYRIEAGERLLFKTRNSIEKLGRGEFAEEFVHLSEKAAVYLAEIGVRMIGVDYLSVGGFEGNVIAVHQALLGAGIWCVEGLDLSETDVGLYEFICLPIRLVDGDGGLARAIARPVKP